MAVTRIQRSGTSDQTVESNARGHTEKNTSKNADATPAKTQFDNPVAKAELVKGNQGGTQSSTAAGQTNVYNNEQSTRHQLDVKAPGEEQAQFKGDHYNPSSTITRSKESDTNQGKSRDDKVQRKRDQERDQEEADGDQPGGRRRRRPRQVSRRKKDDGQVGGGEGGSSASIPAVTSAPPGAGSLPQVQAGGGGGSDASRRLSLSTMKGAEVLDGQSQDLFQPSSSSQAAANRSQERSIREQISMYSLGAVGAAVFTAVAANADPAGEHGMGANMQKTLLNQSIEAMADAPDILSNQFREIVRELVQGTLQASKENDIQIQGIIKMLVTSLMAVSPHDDDPKMMAEALKVIASEIMYGKLNIGYSMKLAAYSLGAALFMLSIYYKNYQKRIEFTKQLEQKLKYACNDGIWDATGEITGYSEQHARENTDRFVSGRIEEEKDFQRNMFRGILLVPLKKMENIPFVRKLMSRFQKGS